MENLIMEKKRHKANLRVCLSQDRAQSTAWSTKNFRQWNLGSWERGLHTAHSAPTLETGLSNRDL